MADSTKHDNKTLQLNLIHIGLDLSKTAKAFFSSPAIYKISTVILQNEVLVSSLAACVSDQVDI